MRPARILRLTRLLLLSSLCASAFAADDPDFSLLRGKMVREQLAAREITDGRVLAAMRKIPRHLFVPPEYRSQAYDDHPLPIGEGQTISQPYIVALMTQCLAVRPGDKVLEVGTGSGYQAAVLAELTDRIYSVEIKEELAREASAVLNRLGYQNVSVRSGDGYLGWPEEAPFDAVIVTCAVDHIPPPLIRQLGEGGRLVLPLGSTRSYQTLTLVTKKDGRPVVRRILDVRFVPMTGEAGRREGG